MRIAARLCTPTGASFLTAPTSASSQPPGLRPVDSPDAVPAFLGKRLLLSFNPLAGYRSGLRCATLRLMPSRGCVFRHCSASIASPASHLLCRLQTSPRYSAPITQRPASMLRSTGEISRGKTQNCPCISAEFIKHTPLGRWRTSLSRASSSRVYHTSDSVRVPRPALSDWASFRPYLTIEPLPFS